MSCPVCGEQHQTRPIKCLQQATLDHVGQCGITTEHATDDCLLKALTDYVDENPQWKKGIKGN